LKTAPPNITKDFIWFGSKLKYSLLGVGLLRQKQNRQQSKRVLAVKIQRVA
jgi:hypothetical protein